MKNEEVRNRKVSLRPKTNVQKKSYTSQQITNKNTRQDIILENWNFHFKKALNQQFPSTLLKWKESSPSVIFLLSPPPILFCISLPLQSLLSCIVFWTFLKRFFFFVLWFLSLMDSFFFFFFFFLFFFCSHQLLLLSKKRILFEINDSRWRRSEEETWPDDLQRGTEVLRNPSREVVS